MSFTSQSTVLRSEDVEQGSLLWLAPFSETLESQQRRGVFDRPPVVRLVASADQADGFYNHPIVVVSRPADAPESIRFLVVRSIIIYRSLNVLLMILQLTSFKGKSLVQRFNKKNDPKRNWPRYLAISPAANHPLYERGELAYRTLYCEDQASSNKAGYVNISQIYEMDWRDAQPYWGTRPNMRLDAESLAMVLSAVHRLTGSGRKEQYHPISQAGLAPTASPPLIETEHVQRAPVQDTVSDHFSRLVSVPGRVEPHKASQPSQRPRIVDRCLYPSDTEPLLPMHRSRKPSQPSAGGNDFFAWLCNYMKRTRLGIIVRFLCCCTYRA